MEHTLVTGCAGFVGSNLARGLLDRGYSVRGIDNFETGRRANLEGLREDPDFEFAEVDIRDAKAVAAHLSSVDTVFHQAAVPSVPRSLENPRLSTDVNCTGTVTVLDAAVDAGVDTVVSASSSSVYGSGGSLPRREPMATTPESPYALTKYFTERVTLQFDVFYDVDAVALRYFNVFGPRQDPDGQYAAVIPTFVSQLLEGKSPTIYGDGEQSRDFTYVDDVVEANIGAALADVGGEVYNVGRGDRVTINALVDILNDILGTGIEPTHDSPRPGDVRHSGADISKAAAEFGYEPAVDFRTGLERTVEWFRNNRGTDAAT